MAARRSRRPAGAAVSGWPSRGDGHDWPFPHRSPRPHKPPASDQPSVGLPRREGGPVMADPALVGELHGRVAEALSSWREREEAGGRPPTRDDQRCYASALIAEELDRHARAQIDQGVDPLDAIEEEEVARTLHAMVFELG